MSTHYPGARMRSGVAFLVGFADCSTLDVEQLRFKHNLVGAIIIPF